ncbi:uncharacterized protein [Nicotiana sylvestris]|uniref:uncharacterized protein n=1 Tax=Nicotiana sylvestris TaxID=4096 RepID=UPI00388CB85C
MAVTTRIGKGRDVTTSSQKKIVDDEQLVQEDEMSSNKLQVNDEVRTDIYDNVEETKVEVNPSREHIIDISEPVMLKAKAPMPRPPHPHPKRLAKKNGENQFKKFIDIMKSLSINVPLVEALEQMPSYAKLMKDLVTKKRSMNCETIKMTHQVHSLAPKLEDSGAFTIPCTIWSADFAKALCDLGESINLMPYSVFKTLGVGKPRPKSIRLQMSDRTMKRPLGIIDDILVLVDKFIFPADFVFLDCEVDYKVPIILGRPFLTTRKALVDLEAGELTFRFGDDKVVSMYASRLHIGGATKEEEVYLMEFGGYLGDKSGILHMSFGLCNVPAIFQRCMMAIFTDMVEDFLEVIVDDFFMVRDSFDDCLAHLDKMLARCEETNLVLNWEKCHFMVYESIVLGQEISKNGIEVDKAMVEMISKLPPPTSVKGVWSFLGHTGFYRRFIKDFSKVLKLTTNPIITAPNWSVPFELMCDASDVTLGAILGQRINKIIHPVYYASKTMNSTQVNYTVTEKELLSIVFAMEKLHPYLMDAKVIIRMDNVALHYIISKKDSKARLMIWVLLLLEFDIDIQDQKGSENQVADHLSHLEKEKRLHDGLEINDSFPDEQILDISMKDGPCFVDLENYLVSGIIPIEFSSNQRKKLTRDYQDYYLDELKNDGQSLNLRFLLAHLYKDASKLVKCCDECQRDSGISKKNEMPLTTILEIDIFDVWSIDFKGPFDGLQNTDWNVPIPVGVWEDCHLPVELDHKDMWDLKKLNLAWDVAANLRVAQLNELDEFRYHAYTNSSLYKEKMKYLHDKYIRNKEFKEGDLVLLFDSRLWMFPGKLKSKWSGPFEVVSMTPFGSLDLKNKMMKCLESMVT